MRMPLTIIIPARKEEEIILTTLEALRASVKTPHRVLVINDYIDAQDRTAQIVASYSKTHPNVSVIIHRRHSGVGGFASTLAWGIKAVKDGVVVFVMADLCDEPETIDRMYRKIQEGWDVVVGSRYMKGGSKVGGPALQGFFSWLVNVTLQTLTGIPTRDISNAFKMYRREILNGIIVDETSGVECSMDWTLQAYFKGAKIIEVPTRWRGRTVGQSKFKILERAPRYLRTCLWALSNSLRRSFANKTGNL